MTVYADYGWIAASWLMLMLSHAPRAVAEQDVPRLRAATLLDAALEISDGPGAPQEKLAGLQAAGEAAIKEASENVYLREVIQQARASANQDVGRQLTIWQSKVGEARELLRFEPVEEAPLPEGFPKLTPVGEIRIQQYPTYRVAKTKVPFLEGRAFFTLFNHIKRRDIAMTAPVEMTYQAEGDALPKKATMAFLYRSTQQGELGTDGSVEVTDVTAHTAVSLGVRGEGSKTQVANAKQYLETWLQEHTNEFAVAGPLRVLGYNSPFIPDTKKYCEVQIPVARIMENRDR